MRKRKVTRRSGRKRHRLGELFLWSFPAADAERERLVQARTAVYPSEHGHGPPHDDE